MKNILVISYHFAPLNVIASYRANAYAEYLSQYGLFPTILTHHWEMDKETKAWVDHSPKDKPIVEEYDHCRIIRLPRVPSLDLAQRSWNVNALFRKITLIKNWIKGEFEPEIDDCNLVMREFLIKHLEETTYDVMLGIFNPHGHLKLCYEMSKRFDIPYILDFRDLWNNRIIHKKYSPSFKELLEDYFISRHWKKWLSKSLFFSITSEPWKQKLEELSNVQGKVITNGFEASIEKSQCGLSAQSGSFYIVHAGSFYSHQHLHVFLEGVRDFINKVRPASFKVRFLGVRKNITKKTLNGFLPFVESLISEYIPEDYYEMETRVPRDQVLKSFNEAQLLLYPSFPDAPGTYAGKIFEYLGAGKNILVVPSDNSVVDELIEDTQGGRLCNTAFEVATYLEECYTIWLKTGILPYKANKESIKKYSRKHQVKKMARYILEALGS